MFIPIFDDLNMDIMPVGRLDKYQMVARFIEITDILVQFGIRLLGDVSGENAILQLWKITGQ